MRLKFSCMMELSDYPLDRQVCGMQISSCKQQHFHQNHDYHRHHWSFMESFELNGVSCWTNKYTNLWRQYVYIFQIFWPISTEHFAWRRKNQEKYSSDDLFSSVSKTTRELQLEWTKVRFIKILADLSYQCSTVGSIIAQLYSVVNIYHNLLPVQSRTVCFSTVHCILSY